MSHLSQPALAPEQLLLSPRTRRRQRGRPGNVLDNVTTASAMTNATVLTPGKEERLKWL